MRQVASWCCFDATASFTSSARRQRVWPWRNGEHHPTRMAVGETEIDCRLPNFAGSLTQSARRLGNRGSIAAQLSNGSQRIGRNTTAVVGGENPAEKPTLAWWYTSTRNSAASCRTGDQDKVAPMGRLDDVAELDACFDCTCQSSMMSARHRARSSSLRERTEELVRVPDSGMPGGLVEPRLPGLGSAPSAHRRRPISATSPPPHGQYPSPEHEALSSSWAADAARLLMLLPFASCPFLKEAPTGEHESGTGALMGYFKLSGDGRTIHSRGRHLKNGKIVVTHELQ